MLKEQKGITLIALVITIIVLLVLAGISISMLTGQNGILNRASEAKDKNGTAQNGDLVKLSAMDALSQGLGIITDANLKTALNNNIGEGKYEITGDATNGWTVTVDGQDYRVEATGIVNGNGSSTGSVNWDKNSLNFVKAVKEARKFEKSHDKLIIIAGACQSDYEELIRAGANFASSPKRINIHALDPAIIASQMSLSDINKDIDLKNIISSTKYGKEGIGGIITKGTMYMGYPR